MQLEEIILPPGNLKMSEWENKFRIAIDSSFEAIKEIKIKDRFCWHNLLGHG